MKTIVDYSRLYISVIGTNSFGMSDICHKKERSRILLFNFIMYCPLHLYKINGTILRVTSNMDNRPAFKEIKFSRCVEVNNIMTDINKCES